CFLLLILTFFVAWSTAKADSALVAAPRTGMAWKVEYDFSKNKPVEQNADVVATDAEGGLSIIREKNVMGAGLRREIRYFRNAPPQTRYTRGEFLIYQDPQTQEIIVECADRYAF